MTKGADLYRAGWGVRFFYDDQIAGETHPPIHHPTICRFGQHLIQNETGARGHLFLTNVIPTED